MFDKKNGLHLFVLFIVLGAITFMASSYLFVRNQATETAKLINEENLKGKFSAVEQYVGEFFNSHERNVYRMSRHPSVVASVLEGVDDIRSLKDTLSLIKPYEIDAFVNLYDFAGDDIYFELELPDKVQAFIKSGIDDESLLSKKNYSLFNHQNSDYLLITEPVQYNGLSEGLIGYTINLTGSSMIERLVSDSQHWFGIQQNQFNWSMLPPKGWQVSTSALSAFDMDLLYASSPEYLIKTESNFLNNLFSKMLLATFLTIIVLYILGRKILVSPFQSLARSEQMLEQQTDALKLKEAEATRLARVAKHMRDAVVFTDTEINITWVNSAFEEMTGFSKDDVLGEKPSSFLQGPESDLDVANEIRNLIDKQEVGKFEIINYTKNRKAYWLEIQITPLFDINGAVEGFMAVERNISDRKELEKSLKGTAEKAEAANIAKSQFLASMSHELRTPMNGVLGMTELIKESELNSEQQEMVNTLFASGKHMLSVLNDILDFSKIEAGKLDLSPTSFYVSEFEKELSPMYKSLCEEKGLTFSLVYKGEENCICIADKTRIKQILQNLLNNAWKFTLKGGISALITVKQSEPTAMLCIEVSDTGIGIAKDKQEHVFQAFSQAESDTTREFGGTGLGLAIISELVIAMKGEVTLESELGKGSLFRIEIPIKLGDKHKETVHKAGDLFDGTGLKVLVVEDNKINVTVMNMFLKKRGFTCDVAENGKIGIEKVQEGNFDLVLMDNHMPVMNGIDSTKGIKALKLSNEPIIIGCTADAYEQTRLNMIEAGCSEVITKPIHSSKLDEILISLF
ncbi:MAG: ATP-binding protein [Colwellia sp.]